ncbi:unnamed protein product [Adineta ricciae]|uniref:G-protein coupled receptors family 1 profile domain-containing protein n=1 Tax=Adineta ricciae TaxID=249248 RepID=A0A815H0F3_ADIRI|nr:unnamed protein product [Adineta ricciae]CAF1458536.1 unnamed protein product [Adineta ricciae]
MATTNNSNATSMYSSSNDVTFAGYYSLLMVIIGTIFNLLIFIVLCRARFRNAQVRSTIHYIRAIAMIDFLGLYGWTLDNYFGIVYGFTLTSSYTIASCKFFLFFNYFTLHISAWLHVFVCFDRYLVLSRLNPNTWFNQSKNVLIMIGCIIGFFFLFNFHILLFVCYQDINGQINTNSKLYILYPLYHRIHLCVYNLIPSFFIILFNGISVYHLYRLRRTTSIQNSQVRHRSISITLIITSILFVIMRTPSSINYAFFYGSLYATDWGLHLIYAIDIIQYTFPILNLPIYLITFTEFRYELMSSITRRRGRMMAPTNIEVMKRPAEHIGLSIRSNRTHLQSKTVLSNQNNLTMRTEK